MLAVYAHDAPPQCLLKAGPASETMAQHLANTGSVHRLIVLLDSIIMLE